MTAGADGPTGTETGVGGDAGGSRRGEPSHRPDESAFAVELEFARAVALEAGRVLMDRYERVERIEHKSPRDVVTEVDHLSEGLILGAIRERFPADAILAEESGEHHRRDGSSATAAEGRTWVVDPLDGTVNYANGIPFFCVSVALVVDGRPAVGVVHDPTRGESFAGTLDGPATLDGRMILVSGKERLSDYVVSLALGGRGVATRTRAVRRAVRIPRSMGSAALALAYVANGRFDAFVQQGGLSAWDIAAAGLVAERAGASVTDADGGPWFDLIRKPRAIGVVAAPLRHHRTLLDLARGALVAPPSDGPADVDASRDGR
ncbi:MAG TPA: inositol monophosphatase family protein [Candidatus Dormibacteraeota bacterium]|nr:inositol monophosphatase family protein [Candidatus Dormibacteraeota bacterium]